jgi:hypothetical protein
MLTAADFKMELHRLLYEAMKQGSPTADVNAGDLHERVGEAQQKAGDMF